MLGEIHSKCNIIHVLSAWRNVVLIQYLYISTYNLYRTFKTAWILLNKGVTLDSGMSRLTKDHSLIYFEIGINVFIVGSVILNTVDLYLLYYTALLNAVECSVHLNGFSGQLLSYN